MSGTVARFVPSNLDERARFAQMLAQSDAIPKAYRGSPANLLLIMDMGDSLGMSYSQAVATINVIDGKPSASAGLISALVRRAGHRLRVSGSDECAICEIVRADDPDYTYTSEWTVDRAVRSGLCEVRDGRPYSRDRHGNPKPWEKYPAALLKARAITEAARDACQEALMGVMYTPEELGAVVDEDGNYVEQPERQPVRVAAETETVREQPPSRPCGHPGDPATKCGQCIADEHNQKAQQAEPQPEAESAGNGAQQVSPDDGEYAAPPMPEEVDEATWVQQWHEAFDAACDNFQMTVMADLGRQAGEHGRPDLVAHAKARWADVAQQYRADQTGDGE